MINKLQALKNELNARFVEREEVINGALVALLARQHLLMVGPPGTAKSELVNAINKGIDGSRNFQWLLTKFSTPEELFGPVSLKALENDEYRRITTGKLPEADTAFLDEIFKANWLF